MESVSKSMEKQLNQLLEEAEEELQQLEEDSLGYGVFQKSKTQSTSTEMQPWDQSFVTICV